MDGFDDELIDQLLKEPESIHLDFKRLGKLDRVLETVVAFANTDGGDVVLGLEDPSKGKGRDRVYGIQENPLVIDELQKLCSSRITPEIKELCFLEIGCTLRTGDNGSICVIRVPKSSDIHSIIGNGTLRRLDKSNEHLTASQVNELSFARGTITAEDQIVNVDFELLDTPFWRQFSSARRLTRPIPEALFHIGLARRDPMGNLKPLRAAVLLFAEDPAGVLSSKSSIRIFIYKGESVKFDATPNLMKPPKTIGGPLIRQISEALDYVTQELATGIEMGSLGFEIVQRYPVRVLREGITNAVIHRDYHIPIDIQIRIFSNRIEIESPGQLPGPITQSNINEYGSYDRNPLIVNALRDFPNAPNLDAGEGVRMMFNTMHLSHLYFPLYLTKLQLKRDAVRLIVFNENRPTAWDLVSRYIDDKGTISNNEVRKIGEHTDTLAASKQLRDWVKKGLLIVANPDGSKKNRRYTKPGILPEHSLLSKAKRKHEKQ